MVEPLALVFLPGLDGRQDFIKPLAEKFNNYDCLICTYEPELDATYEAYFQHILSQIPDRPFCIVAESFGGRLAHLLLNEENARGAVIISSFINAPLPRHLRKIAQLFLPLIRIIPFNGLAVQFALLDRKTNPDNLQHATKKLPRSTIIDRLKMCFSDFEISPTHKPICYIHGKNDQLVRTPIQGSQIITGPHALAYCEPDSVSEIIKSFLNNRLAQ